MKLLCYGLNHQTAPMDLLEACSTGPDEMPGLLKRLTGFTGIREAVGVSTCNRTEFYLEATHGKPALKRLLDVLAERTGRDLSEYQDKTYTFEDEDAVRHLFSVTCGVDSLVVGEREILGQVRRASELAREGGTIGHFLTRLFQKGIGAGRRAHLETSIGKGNVSVASIAVSISQKVFSDLSEKRGLIIGAGQTSKLAAQHFRRCGLGSMVVANRTRERAEELAAKIGAEVISLEQIEETLPEVDVIVAATGSQDYLLTEKMLRQCSKKRRRGPMVLLDLSVPRNIDPKAKKLDFLFLYAIEDLDAVAQESLSQREMEVARVEQIIEDEAGRFMAWAARNDSDQLISSIRRRLDGIRREELERYSQQVLPQASQRFDKFTESLLRGVFHDLTQSLRGIDLDTEEGRKTHETACRIFHFQPPES